MQIKTVLPADDTIRRYVEYYYIVNPSRLYLDDVYVAYPHFVTPVSLISGISASYQDNHISLSEHMGSMPATIILGKYMKPQIVHIRGRVSYINIVFKPLGINHFLPDPFSAIVPDNFQMVTCWSQDAAFYQELYDCQTLSDLANALDQFLLSRYRVFDEPLLNRLWELMENDITGPKISELERLSGASSRTIQRLFKTHLGASPVNMRRILRFRRALSVNTQTENFTQLAYEMHFNDQSHLIKEFQNMTGRTPKEFIDGSTLLGDSPFLVTQIKS